MGSLKKKYDDQSELLASIKADYARALERLESTTAEVEGLRCQLVENINIKSVTPRQVSEKQSSFWAKIQLQRSGSRVLGMLLDHNNNDNYQVFLSHHKQDAAETARLFKASHTPYVCVRVFVFVFV